MASTVTAATTVRFEGAVEVIGTTMLVRIPQPVSRELPSRGQIAMRGHVDGHEVTTVIEPDGRRGHWLRIDEELARAAQIAVGDNIEAVLEVVKDWPEPVVPDDLAGALRNAPQKIQDIWEDITPMARWEWVRWVGATKNPETRQRRVEVSIDKIDHGKRRPCCFDLSACTDPDVAKSAKLPEPS